MQDLGNQFSLQARYALFNWKVKYEFLNGELCSLLQEMACHLRATAHYLDLGSDVLYTLGTNSRWVVAANDILNDFTACDMQFSQMSEGMVRWQEQYKKIHCFQILAGMKTEKGHLGLYSLNGKTSYHKISWSLEAARLDVIMTVSLWYLTGIAAALLPRCLANFRAIGKSLNPNLVASRLPNILR